MRTKTPTGADPGEPGNIMWRIAVLILIAGYCWGQPRQVELRFDEPLLVEGITIDWVKREDSRCPLGPVFCKWEGEVAVHLDVREVSGEGEELILTRRWHGESDPRATGTVEGYLIRLETVHPYPVVFVEVERSDYRAVLVVAPPGYDLPPETVPNLRPGGWGHYKESWGWLKVIQSALDQIELGPP